MDIVNRNGNNNSEQNQQQSPPPSQQAQEKEAAFFDFQNKYGKVENFNNKGPILDVSTIMSVKEPERVATELTVYSGAGLNVQLQKPSFEQILSQEAAKYGIELDDPIFEGLERNTELDTFFRRDEEGNAIEDLNVPQQIKDIYRNAEINNSKITSYYNDVNTNMLNINLNPTLFKRQVDYLNQAFRFNAVGGELEFDSTNDSNVRNYDRTISYEATPIQAGWTEQQIGEARGFAIDKETGEKVPFVRGDVTSSTFRGFLMGLSDLVFNIAGKMLMPATIKPAKTLLEMATGNDNIKLMDYMPGYSRLGSPSDLHVYYTDTDAMGNPVVIRTKAGDRSIDSSQIYSVYGHRAADGFGGFWMSLASGLDPMRLTMSIKGGFDQWSMDVVDSFISDNDKKNFYNERYEDAVALLNLSKAQTYKPSLKAMEGGPFSSWEAFGNTMGGVAAQSLLITAGAFVPVPYFGLMLISADGAAQNTVMLNDMGKSQAEKAIMFPLMMGMEIAIEKLIGPGLEYSKKLGTKTIIRHSLNEMLDNSGNALKRSYVRWLQGNPKNWREFMLHVGTEEFLEEGTTGVLQNLANTISDYYTYQESENQSAHMRELYDAGLISKKDVQYHFGEQEGMSFWNMLSSNIMTDVGEQALTGLLSGPAFVGSRAIFRLPMKGTPDNNRSSMIRNSVMTGQTNKLVNELNKFRASGKLGSTILNSSGEAQQQGDKTWMSEADQTFNSFMEEIKLYEELNSTIDNETKMSMHGDYTLVDSLLKTKKNLKTATDTLKELEESNGQIGEDGKAIDNTTKIKKAKDIIDKINKQVDYLTKPVEDGKYSAAFYDLMEVSIAFSTVADSIASEKYAKKHNINVDDISDKQRTSAEYLGMYSLAFHTLDKSIVIQAREIEKLKSESAEGYVNHLKVKLSDNAKDVLVGYEDVLNKLSAIYSKISTNSNFDARKAMKEINDTLGQLNNFNEKLSSLKARDLMLGTDDGSAVDLFGKIRTNTANVLDQLESILGNQSIQYYESEDGEVAQDAQPITNTLSNYDKVLNTGSQISNSIFDKAGKVYDVNDDMNVDTDNNDVVFQQYMEMLGARNYLKKSDDEHIKSIEDENKILEEELNKEGTTDDRKKELQKSIDDNKELIDTYKTEDYSKWSEEEIYYLGRFLERLDSLEHYVENGFNPEEGTIDIAKQLVNELLIELSHARQALDFNTNGLGEYFNKNNDPKLRLDRHHVTSKNDKQVVYKRLEEIFDQVKEIRNKINKESGATDHNLVSALDARMKVAIFRDIFGHGSVNDNTKSESEIRESLKKRLPTKVYNEFIKLVDDIIEYRVGKDGVKKGKYDYTEREIAARAYSDDDGNIDGPLSENGMRKTEELIKKLSAIEKIMVENKDVFFDRESTDLIVERINEMMFGLNSEQFKNTADLEAGVNPIQLFYNMLRTGIDSKDGVSVIYGTLGYFNMNNEFPSNDINPVDLLKASVASDTSGEVTIAKSFDNTKQKEKETATEDSNYIAPDQMNQFTYRYLFNYLSMLGGMSTDQMYANHLEMIDKSLGDDAIFSITPTFEQMMAVNQVSAFFNGGNIVFNNLIQSERDYLQRTANNLLNHKNASATDKRSEGKDWENDFNKRYETSRLSNKIDEVTTEKVIGNGILVTGDYGAGKSSMIPMIVHLIAKDKISKGETITITISANTDDLMMANVKRIKSLFKQLGYADNKIKINVVNSRDLINTPDNLLGEYVIIDEVSLLPNSHFMRSGNSYKDKFRDTNGKKLIMLGDNHQMSDATEASTEIDALESTVSTTPMTTRFRSGVRVVNKIADYFRARITSGLHNTGKSLNDPLPEVSYKVDNATGKKIGVRYFDYNNTKAIIDEFINDDSDVSRALIVASYEDLKSSMYAPLVQEITSDGKVILKPEYTTGNKKVRIINDNLNDTIKNVQSIQGLGAEHLYIAFDWSSLKNLGYTTVSVAKMMYTVIGRAENKGNDANYVAMPGNSNLIVNDESLLKLESPNDDRNIQSERQYVSNIANGVVRAESNSKVPKSSVTPNADGEKIVNDLKNEKIKYYHIDDASIVEEETGGEQDNYIVYSEGKFYIRSFSPVFEGDELPVNSDGTPNFKDYISTEISEDEALNIIGSNETYNSNKSTPSTSQNSTASNPIVTPPPVSPSPSSNPSGATSTNERIELNTFNNKDGREVNVGDKISFCGNIFTVDNIYSVNGEVYVDLVNEDYPRLDISGATIHDYLKILSDNENVFDQDGSKGDIVSGTPSEEINNKKLETILRNGKRKKIKDIHSFKDSTLMYFFGRGIHIPSNNIASEDLKTFSYVVQNIKQILLNDPTSLKNVRLVATKRLSYLNDEGRIDSSSGIDIVLKQDITKENIKIAIANDKNKYFEREEVLDILNKYGDEILESLSVLGVMENLGFKAFVSAAETKSRINSNNNFPSENGAKNDAINFIDQYYNEIDNLIRSDEQEVVLSGNINISSNLLNDYLALQPVENDEYVSGEEFMQEQNDRGMTVSNVVIAKYGGNSKVAIQFSTPYGMSSLVFITPKKLSSAPSFASEMAEELKRIKNIQGPNKLGELNKSLFFRFILTNKSAINADAPLKRALQEILEFQDSRNAIRFKNVKGSTENKNIDKAISLLENSLGLFADLRTVIDLEKNEGSTGNFTINEDRYQYFDVNTKGVNARGFLVDVKKADTSEKENSETIEPTAKRRSNNKSRPRRMTQSDSEYNDVLSSMKAKEEFYEMLRTMLGEDWESIVEFIGQEDLPGLWGQYQSGRIKYVTKNGKVSPIVLRHEIVHFIIDNMSDANRARLFDAARRKMIDDKYNGLSESQIMELSDDAIDEYIAKGYQNFKQDNSKEKFNWVTSTANKVLGWFKKIANRLFGLYNDAYITKFYEDISSGKYANVRRSDTSNEVRNMSQEDGSIEINEVERNKDNKSISQERQRLLKKLNNDYFLYDKIKSDTMAEIANSSLVVGEHRTIMQAAEYVIEDANSLSESLDNQGTWKEYYQTEEIEVNGEVKLAKDITPEELIHLDDYNMDLYRTYFMFDNIEHFIAEIFGSRNLIDLWSRFSQTGEQRTIDDQFDGIFRLMTSQIYKYNYNPETDKYHDTGRIVQFSEFQNIIKDLSKDILDNLDADSMSNSFVGDDILKAMKKVFKDEYQGVLKSKHYRDNVFSIDLFIKEVESNIQYFKDNNMMDLALELDGLLTRITSIVLSTWNKSGYQFKYVDGKITNKAITSEKLPRIKGKIKDDIAKATLDGGIISGRLLAALNGGVFKGREVKPTVFVTADGLYFETTDGLQPMIKFVNGVPAFTDYAKMEGAPHVRRIFSLMGLETNNVMKYVRMTNMENRGVSAILGKYVSGSSEFRDYKNWGNQNIIAELLYGMYASANQWAKFYQAQEAILSEEGLENTEELLNEAINNLQEGLFGGEHTQPFGSLKNYLKDELMKKVRISFDNIDNIAKVQMPIDEEVDGVNSVEREDQINFPKPLDFYVMAEIIGELEISNDNRHNPSVVYDLTGNRIPINGVSNTLQQQARKGFYKIKPSKTPFKDLKISKRVENGKAVNNPLMGKVHIKDFKKVFAYEDVSSTKTSTSSDIVRIGIDRFVTSALEQKNNGLLHFSKFDIGNRNDEYAYSLYSDSPFLFMTKNNKDTYEVELNNKSIGEFYSRGLDFYKQSSEVSIDLFNSIFNKYGKNIAIDKYIGDNFNKNNLKEAVNVLNSFLAKNAGEGTTMRLEIFSKMRRGHDYDIKDNKIVVGKAISFDSHPLWNIDSYEDIRNIKIKNKEDFKGMTDSFIERSLNQYLEYTRELSRVGYKLPAEYRNSASVEYVNGRKIVDQYDITKGPYYYSRNNVDGTRTYNLNPVPHAHFLIDILHRTFLDNASIGDWTSFNSAQALSKRLGMETTPAVTASTGKLTKLRSFKVMILDKNVGSMTLSTGKNVSEVETQNGWTYGSLLGKIIFNQMFGGVASGQYGNIHKSVIVSTNPFYGMADLIKYAGEFVSDWTWNTSMELRQLEKIGMDMTSYYVNKELAEFGKSIDLWGQFSEYLEEEGSPEAAAQRLYEWILNSENSQLILNNIYMQFGDTTTIKSNLTGYAPITINNLGDFDSMYKGENGEFLFDPPSIDIGVEGLKLVTNLTQNTDNMDDNVAMMNQLAAQLSELNTDENNYSGQLNDVLSKIRELKEKEIKKQINQFKVPDSMKDNKKLSDAYKIEKFLRSVGELSLNNTSGYANINSVLSDPNLDIKLPLITEDLMRMYRSYLNKEVVKVSMHGLRSTLAPSDHLTYYTSNDGKTVWSLGDIEKYYGKHYFDGFNTPNEIQIGDKVFKRYKLNPMYWDSENNNQFHRGKVVSANPMITDMMMASNENLRDIYVFVNKGEIIDTEDMTPSQRADVVYNMINEHFSSSNSTLANFSLDKSNPMNMHVLLRNMANHFDKMYDDGFNSIGEQYIKKFINDFYEAWDEALNILEVRVPTGTTGQGVLERIVDFGNNDNVVRRSGLSSIRTDDDNDGDQNQLYLPKVSMMDELSELDKLKNEIYYIINKAYQDPKNREKIDMASDVTEIRKMISEKSIDSKSTISSFAGMLRAYKGSEDSANAISLFAVMVSTYGDVWNNSYNPYSVRFFKDGSSVSRNLGNWLQIALDSFNNIGIGDIGIPGIAVPLITSYLTKFDSNISSADELNKNMIDFFNNKHVREVLSKSALTNNIDSYNSFGVVINDVYKALKESEQEYTTVGVEDAKKRILESKEKIKTIYSNLGTALNNAKANGLWGAIKNNALLERLTEKASLIEEAFEQFDKAKKNKVSGKDMKAIEANFYTVISDVINSAMDSGPGLKSEFFVNILEKTDGNIEPTLNKLNDVTAKISSLYSELYKDTKLVEQYEKYNMLSKLYDVAVLGESMRRYSRVLNLRNGVPTKTNEKRAYKNEVQLYIGMTLDDFFNGRSQNVDQHIEYVKANNNNILRSKDIEEVMRLLAIERDVYNAFAKVGNNNRANIISVLRDKSMDKYREPLNILNDEFFGMQSPMLQHHNFFELAYERFKATLYRIPTAKQNLMFDRVSRSMIVDLYFKNRPSKFIDVSGYDFYQDSEGVIHVQDNSDVFNAITELDLSNAQDVAMFNLLFPSYIEKIKNITFSANDDMSNIQNLDMYPELRELISVFQNNKFLSKYNVTGQNNNRTMAFDLSYSTTDQEKNDIKKDFARLPMQLKEMIYLYELSRNNFEFRKNSAYESISNDMYYELSDMVDQISDDLDLIVNNKEQLEDQLNRFIEELIKFKDGINYMPSIKARGSYKGKILDYKRAPGDQSNPTGLPIYGKKQINADNYKMTITVDQTETVMSTINGSGNYESNTDKVTLSKFKMIRSIPLDTITELIEAYRSGNKTYSTTLYFTQKTKYQDGTYMTGIGIPVKIVQLDGDKSGGFKFRMSLTNDVDSSHYHKIENYFENDYFESVGGSQEYKIGKLSLLDSLHAEFRNNNPGRELIITNFTNSKGFPMTQLDRQLLGRLSNYDTNIKGKGDYGDYQVVNKISEGNKGKSYRIVATNATDVKTDIRNFSSVGYDTENVIKYSEIRANIENFIIHAVSNPNNVYLVSTLKDFTNGSKKSFIDESGTERTLEQNDILKMFAEEYNKRGITKIDNIVFDNARLLNRIMNDEYDAFKNSGKILDDLNKVLSDEKVVSDEVVSFLSNNGFPTDNINDKIEQGVKKHLEAQKKGNQVLLGQIINEIKIFNAEAYYYVYKNNGYPLSKTSEGASSILFEELSSQLGNETLAYVVKAQMIDANPDSIVDSWNSKKVDNYKVMYNNVNNFTLEEVIEKVRKRDEIKEECTGSSGISTIKAESGMLLGFTPGATWKIVEDLKGPSHANGGIDLMFSSSGVNVINNGNAIKAENGLVIKNEKDPIEMEYEAMSKVLSQRNKHLNWVERGLNPDKYPSISNDDGTISTHELAYRTGENNVAYVYPNIIQDEIGELKRFDTDYEAWEYAKTTNTFMEVPNAALASYYSKNGLIKH